MLPDGPDQRLAFLPHVGERIDLVATLGAGRNVSDAGDDDEVACYRMKWLSAAADAKTRLLA